MNDQVLNEKRTSPLTHRIAHVLRQQIMQTGTLVNNGNLAVAYMGSGIATAIAAGFTKEQITICVTAMLEDAFKGGQGGD